MAHILLALPLLLLGLACPCEGRLGGHQVLASVQRHQEAKPLDERLSEGLYSNNDDTRKKVPLVKYEMVTVYEEAFFEKQTLCSIAFDSNTAMLGKLGVGRLKDKLSLATTKIISIGSSSTQVYSCKKYRGGFFSGWQPESWTHPEEVEAIAQWLTNDAESGEVVLMQNSALASMVDTLCDNCRNCCVSDADGKFKAIQVWPEPVSHYANVPNNDPACKLTEPLGNPLTGDALDAVGLPTVTQAALDGLGKIIDQKHQLKPKDFRGRLEQVVGLYQEKFCRAKTTATVLLLGKKLENDWTKSMKQDSHFEGFTAGTVVDWGGSGPKAPKGCPDFPTVYNNNFLVPDSKLDCDKLSEAVRGIVTHLDTCETEKKLSLHPYLLTQTGLAREKWMQGLVTGNCKWEVTTLGRTYTMSLADTPSLHLRPNIVDGAFIDMGNAWLQSSRNISSVTFSRA